MNARQKEILARLNRLRLRARNDREIAWLLDRVLRQKSAQAMRENAKTTDAEGR